MFVISAERPDDGRAIEALLDMSFGTDRHRKAAYRFRRDTQAIAELSLIARDPQLGGAATLVGSIRYWPIAIGPGVPALLLGPLAVAPGRSGEGIGRGLVRQSLDRAQLRGHAIVLLVGPRDYYGQFGFQPAAPRGLSMPGEAPERLLVAELKPDALAGVAGDVRTRRWVRRQVGRFPGLPGERAAA